MSRPYWVHSDPEPPAEEPEARPCAVCDRNLKRVELTTCDSCTNLALKQLGDIVDLYAALPDHIATIMCLAPGQGRIPANDTTVPGGDPLVMLADGSEGRSETAQTLMRSDAPSVSEVLSRWEDDWRLLRGHTAATELPSVAGAAKYLRAHNQWAADTHPVYSEYLDDLRRLCGRLKSVTGDVSPPVRANVHCFHCNGDLIRKWREDGLQDDWECENCAMVYDARQYVQAVKAKRDAQSDAS